MATGKVVIPEPGVALESGIVTTDGDGLATISFANVYATKPKLLAIADVPLATDCVIVQIESWTQDGAGNYIGCTLRTSNDGGRAEPTIPLIWAIVSE